MVDIVSQLKTKIPELTEAEIAGILYIIKVNSGISNNELIRLTGLPKETLRKFKSTISSLLTNEASDQINLTGEGLKFLADAEIAPYKWNLLEYKNEDLKLKIKEVRRKYSLTAERHYDQFFATEETSVAKAEVLQDKGMIRGKKIAFLGDDDLVSVTVALLDSSYSEITVFDIDERILAVIKAIAEDLSLKNIRTEVYDARTDLSTQFLNKYDVVATDPPYTSSGVSMFLNVGIKLLKSDGFIFFFYGNSFKTPEKTLKVQEILNRLNLVVEDKINKFARYNGAESIGSASSLYILRKTPFTIPLEDYSVEPKIYTFENIKEEKFPFVDHYTFKLFNVPSNILNSKKAVLRLSEDFCTAHKLKIVDTKITQFRGKGLSITHILKTSNLLVHTWPEYGSVHMDLITCAPIYSKENMGKTLSELFKSQNIEIRKVE